MRAIYGRIYALKFKCGVLVCPRRDNLFLFGTDNHITLDNDTSCKLDGAFYDKLVATNKRWHTIRNQCLHVVHKLVQIVKLDVRWYTFTFRSELNAEIPM